MSAFDLIIGYEPIKKELLQICDMIRNPGVYHEMGAVLPRGMLLYGDPGLGKTLAAKAFILESGLKVFTIRKNTGKDNLIGQITDTFKKAAEEAPCIVFLDDLDKFANEDKSHRDAEEYAAVQAGIDDVKGRDVFVVATVNDYDKLPRSLCRPGRFDRQIEFEAPCFEDAYKIIQFYLKGKKLDESVNLDDLSRMLNYESCAALETIMNEAAIYAAFERKDSIGMPELVRAVLRKEYNAPESIWNISDEAIRMTALHEAGHVVVSETLVPESVGMVSIRAKNGDRSGLMHPCVNDLTYEQKALIALGGKAAVEMYYPGMAAEGCSDDIIKATRSVSCSMGEEASLGFGLVNIGQACFEESSQFLNHKFEIAIQTELERYQLQVRDILMKKKPFLENVMNGLIQKETLLYSDIQRIKAFCAD